MEDEIFLDDDQDILDIINFGFPRKVYERSDYFDTLDNYSFFRRFRLRKPTVLSFLEEEIEFQNDLNNSITPMNQFLTTLRLYSCGGHQTTIGDFIGCHQTTVSRILNRVTTAIARTRPNYITMPQTPQDILRTSTDFYRISRFPKVNGCIDGTHMRLQSPGGADAEVFRNRKGYFSINTQVVGNSNLKIMDIVARWPGSAHDQTIFNNSRIKARFQNNEFGDNLLLGDSGYANQNYLLTPLVNPITEPEQLYNEVHLRTRNIVERLFGVWKRRFPILALGMRYKPEVANNIIVATGILHNVAIENGENVPPPPEGINEEQFNYLIEMGNINPGPLHEAGGNHNNYDLRRHLVEIFFAHL